MPVITPDVPAVETAIVAMTNAFRLENKLGEVRPNAQLAQAARAYAAYLARTNAFSHTADGRQPADRVGETGYQYCQVAENLASTSTFAGFEAGLAAAVEGWKNSPGHRRNMLTPHVTEIGVAVAQASGVVGSRTSPSSSSAGRARSVTSSPCATRRPRASPTRSAARRTRRARV